MFLLIRDKGWFANSFFPGNDSRSEHIILVFISFQLSSVTRNIDHRSSMYLKFPLLIKESNLIASGNNKTKSFQTLF